MSCGGTILHIFPTFAFGGVQLRMAEMIRRLPPAWHHLILALDGRSAAMDRIGPEVKARLLSPPEDCRGVASVLSMRRWLLGQGADLVCSYNWGAMDWALATSLTALPHIHFESGFGPEEAVKPLRRRSLWRQLALRNVYRLVTPAESLRAIAGAERWVRNDRLMLIPNGVDTDWFRPVEKSAPGVGLKIVSVAPLRPEKRLDRLIGHIAGHPALTLILAGEGDQRQPLSDLARSLGVGGRVRFEGQLTDIRPALAEADLFAMTSETEQMPNALLQAMASGLPVLAYEAGDIGKMLPEEQRPFVCRQGDDRCFTDGIRRLAADRDLRERLGAANRARALERYDILGMTAAYQALFLAAMKDKI